MCTQQAQEETARRIQLKKEELYDVISKAQQKFLTSRFENKRLLKHLDMISFDLLVGAVFIFQEKLALHWI
jgi:hypothetical protein